MRNNNYKYSLVPCSVVVASCDSYNDTWDLFFLLKERYWENCPYETYLISETMECPYSKTINVNSQIWTKRLREALQQIDTKYVLLMLDDFFIREQVDQERIEYCLHNFQSDTITFNFEHAYRENEISEIQGFDIQKNNQIYLNSCQPSLWDREKLIEALAQDTDAWNWEMTLVNSKYKYMINNQGSIINTGYDSRNPIWRGVRRGKWVKRDMIDLLQKENIILDLSKRGFENE